MPAFSVPQILFWPLLPRFGMCAIVTLGMIHVQGRELWVMVVSASPYEHMIGKPNVKYVANMHGELLNIITLHLL